MGGVRGSGARRAEQGRRAREVARAARHAREDQQALRDGERVAVSECLLVFAGVAGGAGDFARTAIASDLSPSDRERWAGFAEAARAALGSAGFASACARGERLSLDEAVAFALEQRRGEEK